MTVTVTVKKKGKACTPRGYPESASFERCVELFKNNLFLATAQRQRQNQPVATATVAAEASRGRELYLCAHTHTNTHIKRRRKLVCPCVCPSVRYAKHEVQMLQIGFPITQHFNANNTEPR